MIITNKQLKQIIKEELNEITSQRTFFPEGYKIAQKNSNAPFKRASMGYIEEIAGIVGEIKDAHRNLTYNPLDILITVVNEYTMTEYSIQMPKRGWPHGAHITMDVEEDEMYYPGFRFPVTGYPAVDAEFIKAIVNLDPSAFNSISKSVSGKHGTQYDIFSITNSIMPGYPQEFIK